MALRAVPTMTFWATFYAVAAANAVVDIHLSFVLRDSCTNNSVIVNGGMRELTFSAESARNNRAAVVASRVVPALSGVARGDPRDGGRRRPAAFVVATITDQKHAVARSTAAPVRRAQFFKVRYASRGIRRTPGRRRQCAPLTHRECEISAVPPRYSAPRLPAPSEFHPGPTPPSSVPSRFPE